MGIIVIFSCALIGLAVYHLVCGFLDIPTSRTTRMMLLAKKQTGHKTEKMYAVYLGKAADWLSHYIKMDPMRRDKLASTLEIAGLKTTPESYLAKSILTAGLVTLASVLAALIHPLFALVMIGLAITTFFASYAAVFDLVKKRKKKIETEIPRFAMTIAQSLEQSRDVLGLLTSYRRVAGKELGVELDRTLADMKTDNYEQSLLRLERRVSSTMMSDLVRGLIGTLRGDDQRTYFQMLVFDMRQIEQANLKKEAAKRPRQIQKYSMLMLLCIVLIYIVVLSMEVITSLGVFF